MKVLASDLDKAVAEGIVTLEQSLKLQEFLEKKSSRSFMDSANIIYYLGSLVVLSALSYLIFDLWQKQQTLTLFVFLALTSFFLCLSASYFQRVKKISMAAELLSALGVFSFYGCLLSLMTLLGWDAPLPGGIGALKTELLLLRNSIFPPLVALGLGFFMLRIVPFPIQVMALCHLVNEIFKGIASFVLRYGNFAPLNGDCLTCPPYLMVSKAELFLGFLGLYVAYQLDRRKKKSEAFWVYAYAGFLIFISFNSFTYEFYKHPLLAAANIALYLSLIGLSILLRRSVLLVYGLLGIMDFLVFLLGNIFKNSFFFPYLLMGLGVGIIYAGIYYKKNQAKIESRFLQSLPPFLLNLRPLPQGNHPDFSTTEPSLRQPSAPGGSFIFIKGFSLGVVCLLVAYFALQKHGSSPSETISQAIPSPELSVTELKQEAENVEYGEMSIRSEPVHAEVFIDGISIGKTPLTIQKVQRNKRMEMALKMNGYKNWSTIIDLSQEKSKKYNVILEKN